MKYLKTFESFSFGVDANEIESLEHFNEVSKFVESDSDFEALINKLKTADLTQVEALLSDVELASEMLSSAYQDEVHTYRFNESIQKIDTQKMAKEALKYLAGVGIISLLVKVFYKLADKVFSMLDEAGIAGVAGGVLVILLYLAFMKVKPGMKISEVEDDDDDEYTDYEEI